MILQLPANKLRWMRTLFRKKKKKSCTNRFFSVITMLIKSLPLTFKYSALDSLFAFDFERYCAFVIQIYLLKNGVY